MIISINAHSPSVYVLCATADIPLSYLWGWAWLGQHLNWCTFVGTGLIGAGIFVVVCPLGDDEVCLTTWWRCCRRWTDTAAEERREEEEAELLTVKSGGEDGVK